MLTPPESATPTSPLVTMIVLCYNQARFVVETLESVKAQTYKNTELIIVDDCSSDNSVEIVNRWLHENSVQCTFIRHEKNQGICKSLNEALDATTGKYVSMIASDDIWFPDKIARQVALMEAQAESVGVVYSDAFEIDEAGNALPLMFIEAHRKLPQMPQGEILDTLVEGNFIPGMTTLIRRSCYNKVGLYDESLPWEDWDMWMRIARHYSFLHSPAPSANYRTHANSYSRANRLRMIKESFDIGLRQIHLGDLTDKQRSKLAKMLVSLSEELYRENHPGSSETLLATWRATRHRRARWMYRFSKLGFSFRSWQRINSLRVRMMSLSRAN